MIRRRLHKFPTVQPVFLEGMSCCMASDAYCLEYPFLKTFPYHQPQIQGVPGGKDNILGGHSIGHSKRKALHEHVSYSERFPR
jgi:hypothetical protein